MVKRVRWRGVKSASLLAETAAAFADAHSWMIVVWAGKNVTSVTALGVNPSAVALLEEHGFVRCGGPKLNMRLEC